MISENVSLENLHTFRAQALARYFCELNTLADTWERLVQSIRPRLVIGAGSNLLFSGDYPGLIIKNNLRGFGEPIMQGEYVFLEAASGEPWPDFVEYCVRNGWSGVENLALIPGTVGAAAVQNIGAYGVEAASVITEVATYDLDSCKTYRFNTANCGFGYRRSIFQKLAAEGQIITSVIFKLRQSFIPQLQYKDLAAFFSGREHATIALADVFSAVVSIREHKLPNHKHQGNAGSFFKNPEVTEEQFSLLLARFPLMPSYRTQSGTFKIPAAWLIEQCGWKGRALGRAAVSGQHALILVNLGGATGQEILALSKAVQASVSDHFGLTLEPEVQIV